MSQIHSKSNKLRLGRNYFKKFKSRNNKWKIFSENIEKLENSSIHLTSIFGKLWQDKDMPKAIEKKRGTVGTKRKVADPTYVPESPDSPVR